MLIRSAMVANPLTVSPSATLVDFIDAFLGTNQTTAAVVEAPSKLVGMVSVTDIYRRIVPPYVDMGQNLMNVVHEGYFDEKFAKFKSITAGEIMTKKIDTVSPDDAVIKAVALFVHHGRKSLPVIEDGEFIGIITRRSIMRAVRKSVGD